MRRSSLVVVGTYALAWFLLNVFRASLPVLLPKLRELYDVGFTDAGVIFAMLFAGLALMQFPSGLLADAIGDRWVVIASLFASSAVLSVFGLATTVPSLLLLAFLFGVAIGGFRSVAISAVTKAVGSDARSSALGIMAAGNPLGNLLGPIITAVGIVAVGVASVPLILGVAGFAVVACLGLVLSTTGDDVADDSAPMATDGAAAVWPAVCRRGGLLVDVVTSRAGGLVILLSFAFSMTWQGTFTFLPTYLVEVRQLPLDGTGVVTGVTFGVGILANVAAGRAADRIGEAVVLVAGFLIGAASVVVLRTAGDLSLALVALVGLGLSLGAITPARDTCISRLARPDDRGSVVGGVRTVYILLASGGTALSGLVIDRAGFDSALLLFAGVLVVGALAAVGLLGTDGEATAARP